MSAETHKGTCFCGAVEVEVTGAPEAMGYCHCESCRTWSAAPVNGFTLWRPDSVKVTRGAEHVSGFMKTALSRRRWCTKCGGHLFTEHPPWELVDVYASTIKEFPFQPGVHVNYQETVLRVTDGLPKMKDLPKEMGGSGETLPE